MVVLHPIADSSELYAATYAELQSLARRERRHAGSPGTIKTTALVHETWFKLRSSPAAIDLPQKDFLDAEATITKVMAQRKNDPPSSPVLNLLRCDLGNLRLLQHRPREAVEILQVADNAIAATAEGAGNAWRMDILAALSQAQLDNGDAAAAERSGDTALAIARRTLRPGHYQLGIALFALARAKLALGKSTEAESLLREALEVRHPVHPAADPRVLEVQVALVNALQALQRTREAHALRDEIEPLLQKDTTSYAHDLLARLGPASG